MKGTSVAGGGEGWSEPHCQIVAGSGIPVHRRARLFLELLYTVGCYSRGAGNSPHEFCIRHSSAQSREFGHGGQVCFRVAGNLDGSAVGQISQMGHQECQSGYLHHQQ